MQKILLIMLSFCLPHLLVAQTATDITIQDTRLTNMQPPEFNWYSGGNAMKVRFDFKWNSNIGLGSIGSYSTLMTLPQWGDNSGGKMHQLNFNNTGIHYRQGWPTGNWETWQKLIMEDQSGNVGVGVSNPSAKLHIGGERSFNPLSIGHPTGNLHFSPPTAYHNATGITFGGAASSSDLAQAGIYVQSAGSYGTKMYFGTTNNYGYGVQQRMVIDHDGNIGIGIVDPKAKLQVEKELSIDYNNIGGTSGSIHLNAPLSYHNSTAITFGGAGSTPERANAGIYVQSSGSYGTKMYFATTDSYSAGSKNRMIIDHYGNIGIGTTTLTEKLSVNGNIKAKKLIVSQAGWPDYVFSKNYKLKPLSEVDQFIKINNHLPEMPSAKDIESKGLDVGKAQALLLKKIEELTLYVIALKKENIFQQAEINNLKKNRKK
jgi:hypothetical protein